MEGCIFCRIVSRQVPAHIIDETDSVITFLSLENHPLVVPKAHIPNIYGLDDALGGAVMREAIAIAKAVKAGLGCDGCIWRRQTNLRPDRTSSISTCTSIRAGMETR
jgi:histidine triad (HIT) family protein